MELIHALQRIHAPALDAAMLAITQLGSEQAYILLLLVAYLGVDARFGRRLAVVFLAGFQLNQYLKGVLDTPRPFELDPTVTPSAAARATALGSGFPSGHAQSSTTFWGLVAVHSRRRWVAAAAVAVAALVSFSRLYLGVHLPIDVLGGIAIGAAVAALGWPLTAWRGPRPRAWRLALGLAAPFALQLLAPTPDSGVLLGALAAFLTGPELVRHRVPGPLWARAATVVLGAALVFAVQLGTSLTVPDAVRHSLPGAFARYLVVGWTGVLLVPWLARRLRWAPATGA